MVSKVISTEFITNRSTKLKRQEKLNEISKRIRLNNSSTEKNARIQHLSTERFRTCNEFISAKYKLAGMGKKLATILSHVSVTEIECLKYCWVLFCHLIFTRLLLLNMIANNWNWHLEWVWFIWNFSTISEVTIEKLRMLEKWNTKFKK